MKIAFLYGGQGSQVEGMGLDFYEKDPVVREFYDSLDFDFDLKSLSFHGSLEEISKTKITQGVLLAHQIAVTDFLKENGISPTISLGLSLGEYGALYGAGKISREKVMEIIKFRSKEMAEREKIVSSSMAAVISDDVKFLEEILKSVNTEEKFAEISGYNTRKQLVISGEEKSLEKAMKKLKEERIRTIPLNTSGPFHTSYMKPVEEKLKDFLKDDSFLETEIPVYSNYTGKVENGNWVENLSKQVSHRVQLKDSLEDLLSKDYDYILEIGYQEVMTGFVKRIDRKREVISLSNLESVENFIKRIKGEKNE